MNEAPDKIFETSLNKFHYSENERPCCLHTNVKSTAETILKRNPLAILISSEGGEYIIEIPAQEVKHPKYWIRKKGNVDSLDEK